MSNEHLPGGEVVPPKELENFFLKTANFVLRASIAMPPLAQREQQSVTNYVIRISPDTKIGSEPLASFWADEARAITIEYQDEATVVGDLLPAHADISIEYDSGTRKDMRITRKTDGEFVGEYYEEKDKLADPEAWPIASKLEQGQLPTFATVLDRIISWHDPEPLAVE